MALRTLSTPLRFVAINRRTIRLGIAVWAGVLGAVLTALLAAGRQLEPDLIVTWRGARALLAGQNPYEMIGGNNLYAQLPLLYPLPAVVLLVPFAGLSVWTANIVFMALSTAGVAWLAFKDGKATPLVWVFASVAYLQNLQAGQWSAWIMLAVLIPALGFIAAVKPPMAFALWCAYPSTRVAISAIVFTLVTLVIWPWWPAGWIDALRSMPEANYPPIQFAAGPVLLAALWKWRDPAARLLLALACVPQTTHLYGTVPLFLIPKTHVEGAILVVGSWLAKLAWNASWPYPDHMTGVLAQGQWIVWLVYLPCLVMVLRRKEALIR
jgi:hypothetical protein